MKRNQIKKPPRVEVIDDPAWVFQSAQRKVLAAWPGIVDSLIAKAMEGSYQHAKFLAESARLAETAQADALTLDPEELAQRVLQEMLGESERQESLRGHPTGQAGFKNRQAASGVGDTSK